VIVMAPSHLATKRSPTALDTVLSLAEETRLHSQRQRPSKAAPERRTPVVHFNQIELADRWRVSPKTLERWRWLGEGPRFVKIGGRVVYRLVDIEVFEAQQARG